MVAICYLNCYLKLKYGIFFDNLPEIEKLKIQYMICLI